MRTLIQNGTIVTHETEFYADLLIEDGKILEIGTALCCEGAERIDASGCLLFPGFIDTHTHFDLDLGGGVVTADDFKTGSIAAILGGTTTILDFATQQRTGSLQAALDEWHRKAEGCSCDYGFHMAIARWDDATAAEIPEMTRQGVTSYKMYMVYKDLRVDDGQIYSALKYTKAHGALIGMHCENWDVLLRMIDEQKTAGNTAPFAHPLSRPNIVEAEAVSRYLRIAQLAQAPAYVVHLSTAEGLEEAEAARKRGQTVYLETCPQYLVLDDTRYRDADGAKFVMSPPLRKPLDNDRLWDGLSRNTIETIGTDHCSFTMEQKALGKNDFSKIPNGGAGVQCRAQLIYTYGVKAGKLTHSQMASALSTNAAKLFGMCPQKGLLQPGADADIVIWDPAYKEVLSHEALAHNCDNTPFEGIPVQGRARDVFLRGLHVVRDGSIVRKGNGQYVHRAHSGVLK